MMVFKRSIRVAILCLIAPLALMACSEKGSRNGTSLADVGVSAPVLTTASASESNVLVIGGTKGCGLEVVRLLLERGHSVTAIARHPENMPLEHKNLQNLLGDVTNADRIAELVPGHEVIVSAIGVGPTREPVSVFSQGMTNVLAALASPETTRLITVSGIGAGDSRGHGSFFYDNILWPLLLKTVYLDKDKQEAMIRSSNTQWTIVRPGFLTDGPALASYRILDDMEGVTAGSITRADVAHYIVAAIEQNLQLGETVLLSN
ncbi:MAG: NAD(P)H-binding protein [Halioglobus sp.]